MILAILQARVSSSRLPGKVLKPLIGQPMILRQIERIRRAALIDRLVLATSLDPSDDPLVDLAGRHDIPAYRGPLDDVLARFMGAAQPHRPDWVVRLTGDCPLADPQVIDQVIEETLAAGADYGSNAIAPTYPDGLDVEVVRYGVLEAIAQEPRTTAEREHVTLAIHHQPERFKLHSVTRTPDLSHFRWTVDNPEDFELVQQIYEALYPANPDFTTADVLALLSRHPEWLELNAGLIRNEGLAKSLKQEKP
jgi:spore coat polysaccharide biosynthesis protein SpsF